MQITLQTLNELIRASDKDNVEMSCPNCHHYNALIEGNLRSGFRCRDCDEIIICPEAKENKEITQEQKQKQEQDEIYLAIGSFPSQFCLRAYAGIFHIDTKATHIRDDGVHLVVANEKNEQFCNGTVAELKQEIK